MNEYLCVSVWSASNESAEAFNKRLIDFWTSILRHRPDEYALVLAETARFVPKGDRIGRQYLVAIEIADALAKELSAAGIDYDPVDRDDIYSKFEATPPEWFQIPQ